ncbi:hypothetical protein AOLI_G00139720 [Acnodon oligacanthus]
MLAAALTLVLAVDVVLLLLLLRSRPALQDRPVLSKRNNYKNRSASALVNKYSTQHGTAENRDRSERWIRTQRRGSGPP